MINVYEYMFKSRRIPLIMCLDGRVQASMNQIAEACPHTVYKVLRTPWVADTSPREIYYEHLTLY